MDRSTSPHRLSGLFGLLCQPLAAAITDKSGNAQGRRLRWLVFPYTNDKPACLCEEVIHSRVALLVAADLSCPVGAVSGYPRAVFRATVPKTAVYKHRDLGRAEYEVSSHANICQWARTDSVPETE